VSDFVFNPRRAPRAPVRCRAEIAGTGGERWTCETEDVGPRGCQLVAPRRRPLGEPLKLTVAAEGLPRTLHVDGKVAWISGAEPWRLGVAFAERDASVAVDWYEALVARNPALAAYRGVPDRISTDATLFLGPPPRLVVDFSSDEVQVLRCVGTGISVGELRTHLADIWSRAQHALFSLLVRRHVVLARGASVLPSAWKQLLSELEVTLAAEELERTSRARPPEPAVIAPPPQRAATPLPVRAAPPPPPPSPPPRAPAAPPAVLRAPVPVSPGSRETRASMRAIDAGGAWGGHDARHDFQGAGVGWRTQPRPRSPEADAFFRKATLEAEAGQVDAAIGLLRQALQLSPGDPEIAAMLGRLAFR
jgi:hypothetical protein